MMGCTMVAVLSVALGAGPGARRLAWVPGSTKKVCQLTGDLDRQRQRPTLSLTRTRAGVVGTDLGSSFEHKGRLYFLFGDTVGRPGSRDALAWTTSADPERISLEFLKAPDGRWLALRVPGVRLGAFEVPSHGVSIDGRIYVVFTTGHSRKKTMGRSVLAVSRDDGRTFEKLYDLSRGKFINVAFWKTGKWLYVFGSGAYRASSVCLARVEQGDVERREKLRFFAGLSADGSARWSVEEGAAVVLFRHDVVGEFSVAFCEPVGRLVMLYNSARPRGIVLRSAERPWGPWSEGEVVFDPWRDKGYGQFMHISSRFGRAGDSLHDPKRAEEWGGEYGPYLMARYTAGTARRCRLVYTMSTWNPYQVVVMQSEVGLVGGPE